MAIKALDLFEAYQTNQLPKEGGFIVSSFFDETSSYSIYEVVSYNGVKTIFANDEGLTFQSDGKKIFVLTEPPSYPLKHVEPYTRKQHEQIPQRFAELEAYTCKNQTKVYISKEPIHSYSSFTILKPTAINFSLIFFQLPDTFDSMALFFQKTLNKEAGVPQVDAKKAAETIKKVLPNLKFTF